MIIYQRYKKVISNYFYNILLAIYVKLFMKQLDYRFKNNGEFFNSILSELKFQIYYLKSSPIQLW